MNTGCVMELVLQFRSNSETQDYKYEKHSRVSSVDATVYTHDGVLSCLTRNQSLYPIP